MQNRILVLLCAIVLAISANSQTDYSQWITKIDIGDDSIEVLRVPQNYFSNNMLNMNIFSAQEQLKDNRKFYLRKESAMFNQLGQVSMACAYIQKEDPAFPVNYYLNESKMYRSWSEQNQQRQVDENNARYKRYKDSIHVIELKAGYRWINVDTSVVRTKAEAKAPVLGKLYRLSYVKAWAVENQPDWAELEFGDHAGYIKRSDLALKWEDMNLTTQEEQQLKEGRFYSFDASSWYKAKLDKEAAAEARALKAANAAPRRKYIRGPKGGCYYLTSNDNREYVSSSYCD